MSKETPTAAPPIRNRPAAKRPATRRAKAKVVTRTIEQGDTAPRLSKAALQKERVSRRVSTTSTVQEAVIRDLLRRSPESGKNTELIASLRALLDGASADEI